MDTDISGSGKWHTEPTELTEKGDIKRDNICEICEICVGKKGHTEPTETTEMARPDSFYQEFEN